MAFPMYAQPPAHRTLPTTVRVSSYLLYATATVSVITAVITLSQVGTVNDVYKQLNAGTSAAGSEVVVVISTVVGAVVNILFAVGLVILAAFNNRGRPGSRVTTWVIGGIALCCSAVGTALGAAGSAVTSSLNINTGNGPSPAELERRLNDALPSWYTPVTVTLAVISAVAILAALILLALPASNAYFRKTQPVWDPSMPYPQYGAQPPYPGPQPPYPGPQQPYPGGQPPESGAQPPYPGQSGQPPYPPYPGQPSAPPPGPETGPAAPHTGSIPPTDPWSPPRDNGQDRPPTDPPART